MKIHQGVPRSLVCFPACVLELTKKFTKKEKKKIKKPSKCSKCKNVLCGFGKKWTDETWRTDRDCPDAGKRNLPPTKE